MQVCSESSVTQGFAGRATHVPSKYIVQLDKKATYGEYIHAVSRKRMSEYSNHLDRTSA